MSGRDPAFSTEISDVVRSGRCHGLTKREWFAGMAMQGILTNHNFQEKWLDADSIVMNVKTVAYKLADAMLKAGTNEIA